MTNVLIASIVLMLASLAGVFFTWKGAGKFIQKNLGFLVSFSAGVFIVITYQLSAETLSHSKTIGAGLIWILAGMILVWILFRLLPAFHHHHDETEEDSPHGKIDARRILISDAIHNIGDGVLLAASFAIGGALGMITAISIFIHELVQEVSEFFVLKQAGLSTKKALSYNFLVSSTILIGSIGGYYLLDTFEVIEVPLLGMAAGSFLVVVLYDLIPHSIRQSKNKTHYLKHIGWFVVGIAIMATVNNYTVHSHGEDDHDHDLDHGDVHDVIDDHGHNIVDEHHEEGDVNGRDILDKDGHYVDEHGH